MPEQKLGSLSGSSSGRSEILQNFGRLALGLHVEKRCAGPEKESGARRGGGTEVARTGLWRRGCEGMWQQKGSQGREQPPVLLAGFGGVWGSPARLSRFVGRGRPPSSCPWLGHSSSQVDVSSSLRTAEELGERA